MRCILPLFLDGGFAGLMVGSRPELAHRAKRVAHMLLRPLKLVCAR